MNNFGTYDELDQLIAQSHDKDQTKFDVITKAGQVSFDEQCRIHVQDQMTGTKSELTMSVNAYRQIFSKLAPSVFGAGSKRNLPTDYLTAIKPELRSHILNAHCKDTNGYQTWMVRGNDVNCRAILNGKYPGGINEVGQFENTQYLSLMRQLLPQVCPSDFHLVRPSVTSDSVIVRAISKFNNDGGYGIGVCLSNDETGNRKLRVLPLVKRTSCDNSIMLDREGFSMELVHRGNIAAMRTQLKAVMGNALQASAELLDKIIAAEERELEDFETILKGICMERGWDGDKRDAIMRGTENKPTVMGVVNGITYMSHTLKNSADDMLDMETYAGSLLYAEAQVWRGLARVGERELVRVR